MFYITQLIMALAEIRTRVSQLEVDLCGVCWLFPASCVIWKATFSALSAKLLTRVWSPLEDSNLHPNIVAPYFVYIIEVVWLFSCLYLVTSVSQCTATLDSSARFELRGVMFNVLCTQEGIGLLFNFVQYAFLPYRILLKP